MPKMTSAQEAAYALDYGVARSDLGMAAQLEYDRLLAERQANGQAPDLQAWPASQVQTRNLARGQGRDPQAGQGSEPQVRATVREGPGIPRQLRGHGELG